jgi:hypothetical protein
MSDENKVRIDVLGNYTKEEAKDHLQEHMKFNTCPHIVLNVVPEIEGQSNMATVVLHTAFGTFTICAIPWSGGSTGGCLDIQYQGKEFVQQMIGFTQGEPGDQRIIGATLFSLDLRKPKEKVEGELPDESAVECILKLVALHKDEIAKSKRFFKNTEGVDEVTHKHWMTVVNKHRQSARTYMDAAKKVAREHGINLEPFLKEGK